ncbi:hypothetical protein B0H17DRAFT_1134666 [Mycena rosella]|uniref:Uncharacterized protein n=1 Tax=Mycena rosella TaxID=1033263 RepID=A0AAD7DF67_MYCRO|nr:hypothetical protein B0H17DRAFT_1134666 [Mycena rosella]
MTIQFCSVAEPATRLGGMPAFAVATCRPIGLNGNWGHSSLIPSNEAEARFNFTRRENDAVFKIFKIPSSISTQPGEEKVQSVKYAVSSDSRSLDRERKHLKSLGIHFFSLSDDDLPPDAQTPRGSCETDGLLRLLCTSDPDGNNQILSTESRFTDTGWVYEHVTRLCSLKLTGLQKGPSWSVDRWGYVQKVDPHARIAICNSRRNWTMCGTCMYSESALAAVQV